MYKVKLFSCTMVAEREALGERITKWVHDNKLHVEQLELRLTSDAEFHCLSATALYCSVTKGERPGFMRGGHFFERLEIVSATKASERADLGDRLGDVSESDDLVVLQSSDSRFHCVALAVFRSSR